jgi:hypothetical protein
MRRVELSEILDIAQYEKQRDTFRSRIIGLKKRRRVPVGPSVSFVFENHETVLSQVQEMMRAERMVSEEAIQHEIETYNALLPEEHEIAATMLIELRDPDRIREQMTSFRGVNTGSITFLEIGKTQSPGVFAAGQSDDERISAVQFVRFSLTSEQLELFRDALDEVWLVIDHPSYRHRTRIEGVVRDELKHDLELDL